jgi:hypothetical protein
MICSKCGKDQDGRYVEIVTGKLLSSKTSRDGSRTLVNSTYSEFLKLPLWFCQDCWRERRRNADRYGLIFCAVLFGIGLIAVVFESASHNAVCAGLGVIFGLLGLAGMINYGRKYFRMNYSLFNMQLATPKSLFDDFKDFIPAPVYRVRGDVPYWEAQNWQDWMDKKPGVQPHIFHSKA